jgi:lipopolysaccharide transport system permease protein
MFTIDGHAAYQVRKRHDSMTKAHFFNLILYRAIADLRADRERTFLGYLWWFLDPIIQLSIYYAVGVLIRSQTEGFVFFLLVGILTFRWFSSAVTPAAQSILRSGNVIRNSNIPAIAFPLTLVITATFRFLVVLVVLLVGLWSFGFPPSASYIYLPMLAFTQIMLIMALAFPLAIIVPFIPDLSNILDYTMRALFFLSGIFYAVHNQPAKIQFYFFLNPVAVIIDGFRNVLLYNTPPDLSRLAATCLLSGVAIVVSIWLVGRLQGTFAKVIP